MKNAILHIIFLAVLGALSVQSQTGFVIGTINDGEFNDILPFANVIVKGSSTGTTSDFDGKYTLEVEEGTYTLVFSYLGYQTKEITGVVITANSEVVVDVTLSPAANQLEEVVITTTVTKNTEASVLNLQKKSVALVDGLSLQSIKRIGASNIASAVRSVPGVSVQGGKFVFVRGLGDRYTKTILNGLEVPGLDPDRNTLQLDIFPTNLLDNLIVVKSFTADQSADFTGGIVNIVTKDFPSKKEFSLNVGSAYNSDFHFNDQYQTFESGAQPFGFANSSNDLPITQDIQNLTPTNSPQQLADLTRRLDPQMNFENTTSFLNFNLGFTAGNQITFGEEANKRFGYVAAVSYRNETEYYNNFIDGQLFRRSQVLSETELDGNITRQGNLSTNNVLLTGLGGLTLKTEKSKYKLNVLHIQNGDTQSSFSTIRNTGIGNSNTAKQTALLYTERSITNVALNGVHTFGQKSDWNVEWKGNVTFASVQDQDFRITPFREDFINDDDPEPSLFIDPSETSSPDRIWRDLTETNIAGRLDLTKKHALFNNDAKLKFGASYVTKTREFNIDQYQLIMRNSGGDFSLRFEGDPDAILAPENILSQDPLQGTFIQQSSAPSDSFESDISILGVYFSEELKFNKWFNAIIGVRMETFTLDYTGENVFGDVLTDERFLDETDFFPTANLIFDLNDDANKKIRVSYGRTTARPSFKEASTAAIIDPVSGTIFNGNPDIRPTYINNFDLRFESYGEGNNFFAVSGFYKSFTDPIEIAFFEGTSTNFQAQNLGDAEVFGAEIEFRRNLDFIGLDDFSINGNYSIIESQQTLAEAEFNNRDRVRRTDENGNIIEGQTTERQLQGQSPWILNVGLNYNDQNSGWEGNIYYNVQGPTLEIVGTGAIADVFTRPFNDLRLSIGKSFGKNKQHKVNFRVSNLLNDERLSEFESFRASRQIFSLLEPGQTFSLSYSTKF